jgi:hypothetical protein
MEQAMLRTLIFGAIVGLVGKKLYDSGALNEFAADVQNRLNEVRDTGPSNVTVAKPAPTTVPTA